MNTIKTDRKRENMENDLAYQNRIPRARSVYSFKIKLKFLKQIITKAKWNANRYT